MTWKEFKQKVDELLQEKDLSEEREIFFIDIHLPDDISLGIDKQLGVMITD